MYPHLGDMQKLDDIRAKNRGKSHCSFLRKSANACHELPDGFEGVEPGIVCPHNVYHHRADVFDNREGVADTIERIFRLVNASECGLVTESTLDSLSITELLTAKGELDKQQNDKRDREYEQTRMEAQVNQRKGLPSWGE